jgi:SAM-dependent methyltransferase
MRKSSWTVPEILQLSGAFWGGAALQAGVRLNLFTALEKGPQSVARLATLLSCNERALGMLVTALTALGFLTRKGENVAAAPEALRYLSRNSADFLGFIILHHFALMPSWARLDEAVRSGKAARPESVVETNDDVERENFLMGMFNIASQQAGAVAGALDLARCRRLLDLGGGPGTYALYFCKANPGLEAVVFDLPSTRPVAEKVIASFGMADRVRFAAGDFDRETLPGGFDAVWMSQILHGCDGPDNAAALVARAAASLEPGGRVYIQEFVLDDDLSGPAHPALFGLNMLVGTRGGQCYTWRQLKELLSAAGAVEVGTVPAELPSGCGIVYGVMP